MAEQPEFPEGETRFGFNLTYELPWGWLGEVPKDTKLCYMDRDQSLREVQFTWEWGGEDHTLILSDLVFRQLMEWVEGGKRVGELGG